MADNKRVGIIGFGKMGMLHAGIVHALKGYEVAAIAENSEFVTQSLKVLAPHFRVYTDWKEMLDKEKLSSVFITTPVNAHVEMCLECARRGIPFFVEKPLALDAADCKRLVDGLAKTPVTNLVGYMMRHLGTFKKGREILRAGTLGETITFHVSLYVSQLFKKGKGWRYDKSKSGGGLMMGPTCHVVDQLVWYFGPAAGVNAYSLAPYSEVVEDFLHGQLHMQSGVKGSLDSSWSVRGRRLVESRIEIHGTRGQMIVTDDSVRVLLDEDAAGMKKGWTIIQKPEVWQHAEIDIGGPQYTLEDVEFLEAVEEGRSCECDVASSYEVHKIISSLYESAADRGNYKVVNS